jgi:hypothetical protein
METCRVLVVADNPEIREEYVKAVDLLGIEQENAASLSELYTLLPKIAFNGLLLDVGTLVRASVAEKAYIHEIIQIFPSVRIRWDAQGKNVRVLLYGQSGEGIATLDSFIREQCIPFGARKLRVSDRVDAHFNVLISRRPDFSTPSTLKTVTINVSKGGCYIFAAEPWEPHCQVWLQFRELSDPTPVAAEVCWRKMWGMSMGMPGVGVRFTEITDGQVAELIELAGRQEPKLMTSMT